MASTAQKELDAPALLDEYRVTRDRALRNRLVLHFSYIAKAVAGQMRGYTAGYAQLEDIVNQGIVTLIDCIERFDPDKGVKFESYAFMRVKCANIDFIRQQDWLPRRVRKTAKDISVAYDRLGNELMREPSIKELAAYLEVPEEQVQKHYGEIAGSVMVSLESVLQNTLQDNTVGSLEISDEVELQPEEQLMQAELRHRLATAIDELSERERLVISLYYNEHLRLFEIAEVMGISESRVCQLHAKAVSRMRVKLNQYMKG